MSTGDRCLLVGSCVFLTSVGAWLLVAPQSFYATIPGVAEIGPMNAHLLRDVGIAYAVLALGSGFAVTSLSRAVFATSTSALYLGGHAASHLIMELANGNERVARAEAAGIFLPAILAITIAVRFERLKHNADQRERVTDTVP